MTSGVTVPPNVPFFPPSVRSLFSVEYEGKTHELQTWQKVAIVVTAVAGIALLGIGVLLGVYLSQHFRTQLVGQLHDATQKALEAKRVADEEAAKKAAEEAQKALEASYIVPARRQCAPWPRDFVSEKDIIGAPHRMRFLPSPFGAEFDKVTAVTKDSKHVMLQQAIASCVPTCVAMLVLDNGGEANYESLITTHFADEVQAMKWIDQAGFSSKLTLLYGMDENTRIQTLIQNISQNGPGILTVNTMDIGAHVVVLDAISIAEDKATIRDSFHGWRLDIRLGFLKELIAAGGSFIQITGKKAKE